VKIISSVRARRGFRALDSGLRFRRIFIRRAGFIIPPFPPPYATPSRFPVTPPFIRGPFPPHARTPGYRVHCGRVLGIILLKVSKGPLGGIAIPTRFRCTARYRSLARSLPPRVRVAKDTRRVSSLGPTNNVVKRGRDYRTEGRDDR